MKDEGNLDTKRKKTMRQMKLGEREVYTTKREASTTISSAELTAREIELQQKFASIGSDDDDHIISSKVPNKGVKRKMKIEDDDDDDDGSDNDIKKSDVDDDGSDENVESVPQRRTSRVRYN